MVTYMDLGAFLQAGRTYPVVFQVSQEGSAEGRPVRGVLSKHRGRLVWMASGGLPVGVTLPLAVEMKGFVLGEDASLCPSAPDDTAEIVLVGRVKACRLSSILGAYSLRLELLGRVLR